MKENTTNEAQYSKNPENKLINCSIGVIHINTSHKNDLLNKKRIATKPCIQNNGNSS